MKRYAALGACTGPRVGRRSMLRLAKVAPGGHGYYLEVAAGTGTGIEAAGRWLGASPGVLGLADEVASAEFAAVLAGCDPASGEVLGGARRQVRVAAFDLTFGAPKSVSLLHALGPGEVRATVGAAHDTAVDAALSYVERHALGVRRGTGQARRVETAAGTPVAGFVHRTSRAGDPHLHTHAVTANLARGPDGRWGALDGRGIYAHASAAGAIYHAQLRHELTAGLGVAWGPLDRGRADIAGIGPEARRVFSTRAAQIAAELAGRGAGGSRARQVAWARTRAAKDVDRPVDELVPSWRARAVAVGLGPGALDAVIDRVPRRSPDLPGDGELGRAVAGQLAGRSSVARRDVVRASCRALPAGASLGWVEDAVDRVLGGIERLPGAAHRQPGDRGVGRVWDGPGVSERRMALPGSAAERGLPEIPEREALDRLLARRGMERSAGLGRDEGLGLG